MANRALNRLLRNFFVEGSPFKKRRGLYEGVVYNVIRRFQSHLSETGKVGKELEEQEAEKRKSSSVTSLRSGLENRRQFESGIDCDSSSDEDTGDGKWKLDLAWLTKALEPAMQLRRWALPTGEKSMPGSRSLSEIIASIQRSKLGIEGWTFGDLTIGLYLIYLRQASLCPFEDVKGVEVVSESTVYDLIYNAELAKGCYRDSVSGLAKNTMLRENNILKFVKDSSVMRPGYYIGVDHRRKLVVFGIRGTHTIYDLITDIVSSSDEEVTFEGYSTHFGTAEAARWFLNHELQTIRRCLAKYEGYKLRLVGHSLGGAIASLMAIMLRKMPREELGFDAEIISAVGYATPPCVSKELAENCSDFVTTIVMQDDIIPRLSAASLARLRNEILQTDWTSIIEKEEWKNIMDLVTNAKQVVTSVQDVARKVSDYANFGNKKEVPEISSSKNNQSETLISESTTKDVVKLPEELYVPGAVYYLMRNLRGNPKIAAGKQVEYFSLWKRDPGQHFQRILLSGNFITDHKCDSHYYALRDVLKGFPSFIDESIFKKRCK
ncbi:lipase class 3 family protein [Arabidopsis lyrata subsp. lyrata]|uniref:Lipase class 3 family protein n=1 Tax=Arabidopsis lyrata subsp. lyrata TaxID=81972 RepID=D7LIS0_ARALL|nr:sn1-specific diacylglycerol lipase beta [Arabidopsis lyrata subsp. lyrata]EFH58105.1 lipase class 3 family protein [Arabidopsis lyrata subsp. lyrata]|eukprot:XP_002881846.1 sn1-specific diacylglycerol lipase beta [Arabidopsis lyrata subsp. lyrata]